MGERNFIEEIILYTSVSKYGDSRGYQDLSLGIIQVLLCCNQKWRWAGYQNVINHRLSMMSEKCTANTTVTTTIKEREQFTVSAGVASRRWDYAFFSVSLIFSKLSRPSAMSKYNFFSKKKNLKIKRGVRAGKVKGKSW